MSFTPLAASAAAQSVADVPPFVVGISVFVLLLVLLLGLLAFGGGRDHS
jgi:hypothetical protein